MSTISELQKEAYEVSSSKGFQLFSELGPEQIRKRERALYVASLMMTPFDRLFSRLRKGGEHEIVPEFNYAEDLIYHFRMQSSRLMYNDTIIPPGELNIVPLALIATEAIEAIVGQRAGFKDNVAEELADIVIRTADVAERFGVDLEAEIEAKMQKNRQRPERNGSKAVL